MPLDFLEETVEDIVFDNRSIIHQYGLPKFKKHVFRQAILPSGKKMDIVSFEIIDGHLYIDIYELKLRTVNTDTVCQAYGYFMEMWQITAGFFKSIDIHIILVGKYYEPIPIFEKMKLPFSVYSYDYSLNGISFKTHQQRRQKHDPHENFCFGLWAFGTGLVHFSNGQPSTVNLASEYGCFKQIRPDAHKSLKERMGSLHNEPIIKEIPIVKYLHRPTVETKVFPEQPLWSKEFQGSIPHNDIFEDAEIDLADYEIEPAEPDSYDYEVEWDDEDDQPAETPTLEEREALIVRLDPIEQAQQFINKITG
jgi:hypothetical protein